MLRYLDRIARALTAVAVALALGSCVTGTAPEPIGAGAARPPGAAGPGEARGGSLHRIARVRGRGHILYATAPGGRLDRRLEARTRFGTRRALSVVRERHGWLGVAVEDRPNRRLAWLPSGSPTIRVATTPLSLHADLSRRRVELRRAGRALSAVRVGVGRRENRTPTGRFAVTDKLSARDYPAAYGCCILALSGHQARVPPGWTGGDRLAIHGTNAPDSLGRASSSGCLRVPDAGIRRLMRTVPVGTPVFVRR